MNNILSQVEGFEWDVGNLTKNWDKQRVSQFECEVVFFNEPLIVQKDKEHSKTETRYLTLGKTNNNRLLFVAFTIRNNKIRVISTKDMTRQERQKYE